MSATSLLYNPVVLASALLVLGLAAYMAIRRRRTRTISPITRQAVLDGMRDGLIVVDQAGLIVEHNLAAADIAALDGAAVGRSLAGATRNRALAAVLNHMLAGASESVVIAQSRGDSKAQRKQMTSAPLHLRASAINDREPRHIQITRTPLDDPDGRRLGTLFMLRDVTAQMRAEAALERQATDLTTLHHVASAVGATLDLHELLRAIVTTTRDALGMAHATVGMLDETHGALTITAESDDAGGSSAIGTTIALCGGPFEEHWRSATPIVIGDTQGDTRLGSLHDLLGRRGTRSLLIVPLHFDDRLIGTLNLASATPRRFDVEELALAQMIAGYVAAAIANARLFQESQQAVRIKSAILDTVSHEFRTPLTAILGFAELYGEGMLGSVTEEQQEAIEAIDRNAHRLLKLVDDLLDLARLEAGKLDMVRYPIEVRLCIEEAVGLLAKQLQQKRLDLRLEIAADLPFAWADAMWLRRVLVNLLTNAIRFTSAGAITVRAYVDERPTSDDGANGRMGDGAMRERHVAASPTRPLAHSPTQSVVIEVEDTGQGIPELEQQTIFEAFRRADDTLSAIPTGSGSGLGLTISKRAIDQMDGLLTVRSRPGQGSTFTITLQPAELVLEHPIPKT